jgi:CDP-glycerol glycerophosphotransferase (TagB/SpsB family)
MGAQDNGYYFFRYCMEHKKQAEKQANFYYVIDKKSPDYDNVRKYGRRVVPFLSIRHMVYMQAAEVLISTDSKPHAYAWRQKGSILYEQVMAKKSVFLQHGVTGFKNVNKLYTKKADRGSDLFIATSQQEKAIIHQKLKYPNKDIAVTGFARWDVLKDKSGDTREILVMPTWRNWLDSISDEEFCESNYFKHYEELLESERLKELLEQKDLYLTFYLHPIMRNYIHVFQRGSRRIRLIAFGEQPLNEIMMRSKLMITDYSSASWDMFYMKKPVIFYQFDAKDYLDIHGSYLDFEQELFGARAVQLDSLLDCITSAVDNDFKLDEQYHEKYERAFLYVDDHNSERILKAIQKMMRASDE